MSGINSRQLRELVIRPIFQRVGLYSPAAEALVLGTAAAEGVIGNMMYLKQAGGPALGIFQMEPSTHKWLVDWVLSQSSRFTRLIEWVQQTGGFHQERLVYDLAYMAVLCRLRYVVVPQALPSADNVHDLGVYWKQHYNTHLGKGTVDGFVRKFREYVG